MHPINDAYLKATYKTANDLKTVATALQVVQLSRLSLPEVEHLTEEIARVVPAGNVPGLILSGLVRLEGRRVSPSQHQQNIALLFRGVRDLLDKAVYTALFAGPAAVITAYQHLLKLAGKDVESAFPEGTWQFYLEFALREDSARHANETTGFQTTLASHHIKISDTDALTAWIMASLSVLHNYPRLLENEWRERITISLLKKIAENTSATIGHTVQKACSEWDTLRPYARAHDAGNDDYAAYRRRKYDTFVQQITANLPHELNETFQASVQAAERDSLPSYLQQMSILAYLESDTYREKRVPFSLSDTSIAIIVRGQYYLIPASINTPAPSFPNVHSIRSLLADLLQKPHSVTETDIDLLLVSARRAAQAQLRSKLDLQSRQSINALQRVPIIVNWDRAVSTLPLALIRRGRRGIGDHALTLFFTADSTVFDQSHIFFDGAWGAALAEIMTNEALSWALYLSQLPSPTPISSAPQQLTLRPSPEIRMLAEQERLPHETTAESSAIRLSSVQTLRRLFKARNDLVNVTVNDLLVLYRSLHGQRYQPSPQLQQQLDQLRSHRQPAFRDAFNVVQDAIQRIQRDNPALLIPMDASQQSPKERIYPTTFRNPLIDLHIRHQSTLEALRAYQNGVGDRGHLYQVFDESQRIYLQMIASFGILMRRYKEIAISGQSTSTTTIKMMAHMPDPIQRLLDQIPGRFDVLNEIIKGEEVFSNVGRVSRGSSLRRFVTAKDDNEQKTLAWGFVTDDQDRMHVSLRDFRPHVTLLTQLGMTALAQNIAQDFLNSYTDGFNLFIRELREITIASRETKSTRIPVDDEQRSHSD